VEKKKFYSEEEMAIKLISILYKYGEICLEVYRNVMKHYDGEKSILP
jgi:hypothetical protein